MSTLDSSSTLSEIKAAYADNASYQEDALVSKARAFATACRLLLMQLPKRMVHGGSGGEEVELDLGLIRIELETATKWLTANSSSGAIKHVSYENFR